MRILVINFYSPRNLGDLAILEQTVWVVRKVVPSAQFDVLVSDLHGIPHWSNVNWVPSWSLITRQRINLRDLHAAYMHADLILSLGGGYFFAHDYRPFPVWATISLAYALRWRKPVICLPQSFGPFRFAYQARLVAALMAGCTEIYLRDPESLELFRRYAPRRSQACFAPDTAFTLALRYSSEAPRTTNERPHIGVTAVDWSPVDPLLRTHQPAYESALAETLQQAWHALGAKVNLFLQCQSMRREFESDSAVTERIYARLAPLLGKDARVVNNLSTPLQALTAYRTMDIFVATRMHSALFAACAGVPVIGIGYQPKMCALMRLLDQSEFCLALPNVNPNSLGTKLYRLWNNRGAISAYLSKRTLELAHAAEECLINVVTRYRS